MTINKFDDYLRAYQSETDQPPSRQFLESILAVPDQLSQTSGLLTARPWRWFDLMIPKAVGWVLTCCLGIYIGLSSPEGTITTTDEELFLYDQAQLLLSEEMDGEDTE